MKKHANIAIFIPHLGCPNDCAFCNQKSISGIVRPPTVENVEKIILAGQNSLGNRAQSSEIAFFGGSFTGIDRKLMITYLETANKYIGGGGFAGIRISTRPDCIDDDILEILKKYRVTAIELGAQSMSDSVLAANMRGHKVEDTIKSSMRIRDYGFSLGLQIMTGLYKSTHEDEMYTMDNVIDLNPDTLRIYPTLTLKNTYLAELYFKGKYTAHSLENAVETCSLLLRKAVENGINVIRLGLHNEPELAKNIVAGAYHPAFRELCESRILYNKIIEQLDGFKGNATVKINSAGISKVIGQKRENIIKFKNNEINIKTKIDDDLGYLDIVVEF